MSCDDLKGAPIHLDNLTITYQRHPAVHHVAGSFEAGSLTAIIGPNGAGKSTLIKALTGTMAASEGRIDRAGMSASRYGYLPQAAEVDRSFPLSVFDTVAMGDWHRLGIFGGMKRRDVARALDALDKVGLAGFEQRRISELSSGQFQRVLFARLLLQDAPVILLDEPFNAIDERTTRDLLALIRHWHEHGRTVIAVLHDMSQVRQCFPQTLLMAREAIAWGPTEEVLQPHNLRRANMMEESWIEDAHTCELHEEQA
ncbi:metal ABC transporter ATP-binding protein [Kushneria marisflavi]|uniref:ABC transporter n=1 Tax=Kushneria marisflavi TaxID=157779 RepID=A0A240UQW6_9GAMM|nr:ABC transporter ATP-binding protein [Kushneria marisflavi]ART63473.1 ABC transporter [Kushneria marisflavi]RKD84534.1 zinc/manganese transport system ATP-binding protein [Kushneria marisflavi]